MAGSNKLSSIDFELFNKVFTEGPLEVLISKCDAITASSFVGSSNSFIQAAKGSATLPARQLFDLPCVLHSHPTRRPWEYNDDSEVVGSPCQLTPLDRLSSDAFMPNDAHEQWAGANGDWIVTVGRDFMWQLVNVYTRHKIPIPPVPGLEDTDSPLTFTDDDKDGHFIKLMKIVICQVPTALGRYEDYSLIALFDYKIVILDSDNGFGWTVLDNQFQDSLRYCDAIIHGDYVFAAVEDGSVYTWEPYSFGPLLLSSPRAGLNLVDGLYHDGHGVGTEMWWLARSSHGSRLLLVYTRGINSYTISSGVDVHYGRTVRTYASGLDCLVFSMDTKRLLPAKRWKNLSDIGSYSLFLGVNYPINIEVGGANVAPGDLARGNCVYTSHQAIGSEFKPHPEICRFSLNGADAAVGFSTSSPWIWSETPVWFIPSFANALEWNKSLLG